MIKTRTISGCYRRVFLSVMLLWGFLLYGQQTAGYSTELLDAPEPATSQVSENSSALQVPSLLINELHVPQDALAANFLFDLHHEEAVPVFHSFSAPSDEDLPPGRARCYGAGLLARLFPITIQPNAP
ncbi:hypothetical protein ACMA1I_21680 [Pontibacter sp. 13R65]|uniref:hypothetical protein n=1 Tax=Pontibacter sp. 13R65 TaxID=3127458 RepID=UPI00301CEC46